MCLKKIYNIMYPSSAVKCLIYMQTTADKIFEHINYQKHKLLLKSIHDISIAN
jgi:hypothetical protein